VQLWKFGWAMLLCIMLFVFCGGQAFSETRNSNETIIQHLEFLGYQCENLDQGIKAIHPSKLGFVLIVLKDGLMAQSALASNQAQGDSAKGEAKLSAVNTLNKESTISRFFWADSGELVMRASIFGAYDKGRFYTFMEAWEKDGQAIGKHYDVLKAYLK
jgi:hypothetical protein